MSQLQTDETAEEFERKHTFKPENNIVEKIIRNIAGEEGIIIAKLISTYDEVTDEEIAERLNVRVNLIRKILYKLYENGLAKYRRVRDPETGWFIFYWTLNLNGIYDLLYKRLELVLKNLRERLEFENSHMFYRCENHCVILPFEEALEYSFHCPKCGGILEFYDNTKLKEALNKAIKKVEENLKKLQQIATS
ncbi:MAG: transcription factor E [Candidatus Odinarchaeota archaeon]|nr:transcription factor E [Candidatus Odinarchaeota archaeon]